MTTPNAFTVDPKDVEFALTTSDFFAYLEKVVPGGPACPVCGAKHWAGNVTEVNVGTAEHPVRELRVLPDGETERRPFVDEHNTTAPRHSLFYAGKGYSYVCGNCGHMLTFSALMIALRTAASKKTKEA